MTFCTAIGSAADSGFGAPSAFGNQGVQGAPGFGQGQQSFGGQANNFGPSGSSSQCKYLHKKIQFSFYLPRLFDIFQFKVKMMVHILVAIIQLFPVLLVLIIQFIRKFQRHHSIAKINNFPATMLMLKHNVKYSIFAH